MGKKREGGYLGTTPTTWSSSVRSGMWNMRSQFALEKDNLWPTPPAEPVTISRSLRFNSADSAYLSRTPSGAGNRKTWTWSGWLKRSELGVGSQMLFDVYSASTDAGAFSVYFSPTETLTIVGYTSTWLVTSQVFKDTNAWYHLVLTVDTTQATADNRVRLYVNGSQVTAFSTRTNPSQNADLGVNQAAAHTIGRYSPSAFYHLNGYLAETHFVDGQALTPSSFGATDQTTGLWTPINYIGTYGTNGFYLDFSDNSGTTSTTLGKDRVGSNDWTPNNFSVTAGAGNDSLVDTPTSYGTDTGVGGEVRGNYCTLNPLQSYGTGTLASTDGNLVSNKTVTNSDSGWTSTFALSSGKWYAEYTFTGGGNVGGNNGGIGVMRVASTSVPGELADTVRWMDAATLRQNASSSSYGTALSSGDVLMVAFDADNNRIWFGKNGTWFASGNPATGSNPSATGLTNPMVPATYHYSTGVTITCNFGQRPFAYTAPSGFKALVDTNLPEPTIVKGNTQFDIALYTGNASARDITGLNFSPDLVWIQNRSSTSGYFNAVMDAVRGNTKILSTNNTAAEVTYTKQLTSFNADGFSLGDNTDSGNYVNLNTSTYVAWAWNSASANSTNSDGTIASTVRANASAGFSIVSYDSNPSGTVGHGLGVAPKLIIEKKRDTTSDWLVGTTVIDGSYDYLRLNTTDVKADAVVAAPTASVFTPNASGDSMIAYCFAPVAGYSAFGSYIGNGSTDGVFIYTGFRPRWLLIKNSSNAGGWSWIIRDTSRDPYNPTEKRLWANLTIAESTNDPFDILSNGFKLRINYGDYNASSNTYIYAAFAENPFKYARAR